VGAERERERERGTRAVEGTASLPASQSHARACPTCALVVRAIVAIVDISSEYREYPRARGSSNEEQSSGVREGARCELPRRGSTSANPRSDDCQGGEIDSSRVRDQECACASSQCIRVRFARGVECEGAAARLRATAVPGVPRDCGSGKGKSVMRGDF